MKKRTLSRLLAAFLAVMLMAQSLCLTAFAEETTLEATPEAVTETEPVNETVINEPEVEEPEVEEPEVEEPKVEELEVEEPKVEEPKVEEPVAEGPVVEEPVAEEPVVEEPETESEVVPVNIPADSSVEQVNRILTTAILGESTETKNWEYHCQGKTSLGIPGNASWGSIEGFTSEVITTTLFGKKHTTTYTHLALAANKDGNYQVRVAGNIDTVYTIEKSAKLQGSITLHESPSAALNSADLKSAIFSAVVAASTPAGLTADAVTMEYYATPITGAVGSIGMKWVPLEGEKVGSLTTYPAIGLGEHEVRISWNGNDIYAGFKTVSKIQITSGKQASAIELRSNVTVPMVYGENAQPDIAATKTTIFSAVVASSTPAGLTADAVTMEYYATPITGAVGSIGMKWVPLEGEKVGSLTTYPAIGLGEQKIRISWGGSEEYDGFFEDTTITLTERPAPEYTLKESPSIKLVYNDDLKVDYENIESTVFDAIVDSADFSAKDVRIEYYATATTGSAVGIGQEWVPLKGGKVSGLTYPAISEGTWTVHIIYPGSQTLAPVTITQQDLEVRGREPMQFNLKEGPYTVGMVFNEQQGYDFAATAKAIYEAVVESTVPTLNFEDVKVEFNASPSDKIPSYRPLDYAFAGQNLFGEGTWTIRISWGGSKEYAPGDTVVSVTTTDNRIASQITLKSDASFTYNMDVTAMKQAVLDNVIDWNASTLPAKDTLSLDDFTFEYKASLSILDGVEGEIADKVLEQLKNNGALDAKVYVPFEGKNYDTLISGQTIAKYPQIGAGVQSIRVTYKGSAEYKPSQPTEGSITVNKAKVKVHVKSASMYVSEAVNGLNLVTTTPDDHFNTFVVYAGVTRNVTTAVYLQLPESYTSNQVLIKLLDKALESLGQPTFTEMLQNGITLGQLRQLLRTKEIVDILEKIGIDTGALGQLIEVIDKLPAVGDNFRIAVGVPNRAGAYSVTAITDNKNYNVGVGVGALVLKADKAKLVWKQDIGKKISAADAKTTDFAAELQMNGTAVSDQSSVHVLYSGLTSKWKAYSSTTKAPTEPGRYVMTVVVLGGNYQAAPITRSFQITK